MFDFREVAVEPGRGLPYDELHWLDALVLVEHGEIELECITGGRQRFPAGSVLWLTELPLRAIHNRGSEPALLVAVSRRR